MSKITLSHLSNLQNEATAVSTLNANSDTIVSSFDNILSRDGTSPNQMMYSLDMNSNQILNLPIPSTPNSPARLTDLAGSIPITINNTTSSNVPGTIVLSTGTTADYTNIQNAVNAGGTVYLTPGATYNMGTHTLVFNHNGTTLDGGNTATTLSFTNTTADNVLIGNSSNLPGTSNVYLKNLTILDAGTRISGQAVEMYGAERTGLEKVVVNATGAQTSLWAHNFNDIFVRDCRLLGTVLLSGTGSPGTQMSDVFVFDHTLIQPNTRAAGLIWDGAVHTVRAFGLTILNTTIGLTISNNSHAATDHVPEYGEFYNLEIDGASQQAIWIQGGIIMKFIGAELNNNQSTADVPCIQIDPDAGFSNTRAIQFIGGYANDSWGRGVVLNCADTTLIGLEITGCSRGSSGTYSAINITGTNRISIIGSKFYSSGSTVPSSGIKINGGAVGPFYLADNNYINCAVTEIDDGNVGTSSAAIIVGGVSTGGKPYTPLYSIATLPGSPPTGLRATIFNGIASPTYHQTVSATGSTTWPVFFNGANWVYD